MGEITREQHFVPQVHLKKFTDHHDKKIFVYDKNFKKLNKKYHPVQICKRDYLYEFNTENPDNKIEHTFSYIEKKFAQLYEDKLIHINQHTKHFEMSDDEKLIILYYVIRMDYGNIVNKTTGDEDVWKMWERTILENCKSKEDLEIAYEKMNEEKHISEQQRIPIQIDVIFDKFIIPLFNTKNIIFIFNKNGAFITSDNPVNNYLAKSYKPGFYGPNIFEINYQIGVSPSLIVAVEDQGNNRNNGFILYDLDNVAALSLNSTCFDTANSFIYSPRILTNEEITAYKDYIGNNQK